MLGRGLVSRPTARQIAAAKAGQQIAPMSWEEFRPVLVDFWQQARERSRRVMRRVGSSSGWPC